MTGVSIARASTPAELVSMLYGEDETLSANAAAELRKQNDPATLPLLLVNMEKARSVEARVTALELAAPICDATCVPYLTTALRERERGIVLAAARAAGMLARSELRPALLETVSHHADDEVRFVAAQALTRTTPDELFGENLSLIHEEEPDAASLAIVRAIPPSRLEEFLPRYVELALNETFATSAVSAYTQHGAGGLLFKALITKPIQNLPERARLALIKAARHLAPYAASSQDETITNALRALAAADAYIEDIQDAARILAPFDGMLPEILRLSVTYQEAFTPNIVSEVIELLSEPSVDVLLDVLFLDDGLTSEPFGRKAIFSLEAPTLSTHAVMKRMIGRSTGDVVQFALDATHSRNDAVVRWAVAILGALDDQSEKVTVRLSELMGHHAVAEEAALALHASGGIVGGQSDVPGPRLYARWALAASAKANNSVDARDIIEALEVLKTPRRRHALPALALLIATHTAPPSIDERTFDTLSSETQRLWIEAQCAAGAVTPDILRGALSRKTTRAQALTCLEQRVELANDTLGEGTLLTNLIRSTERAVALRAMRVTRVMAENQFFLEQSVRAALESRLYDDELITHNALHALQALHALPARETLAMLYTRASQPYTRNFLALLLNIPEYEDDSGEPERFRAKSPLASTLEPCFTNGMFDIIDTSHIAVRFGF